MIFLQCKKGFTSGEKGDKNFLEMSKEMMLRIPCVWALLFMGYCMHQQGRFFIQEPFHPKRNVDWGG